MKKTLLIASLLAVALAACGKKEEVVPVTPAVVETPAPAPAAAAPAAPAAPAADAPAAAAPATAAPAMPAPAAPAADAPAAAPAPAK